jgi:hypothetical protein
MASRSLALRWLVRSVLAAAFLLSALTPARAAVTTVYNCSSSGHNGNHDYIYNGFFVQNLAASNLHTVVLYYTTDQTGSYTLTLTARRSSYAGPLVATLTKTVSLSSSSDTAVTWDFADAALPSGSTVYFTHTQSGTGSVQFNTKLSGSCVGDEESVGTSSNLNGFSVAVTITQNTTSGSTACVANATTLCIDNQAGDKRFQIQVTYSTAQAGGLSGSGHAIPLASLGVNRGGLFWFFGADNPEMLIKILNGCSINSRFWVYYSAGTNVGFHVTVTDTQTGHAVSYNNTDLTPAPPVQDAGALACQ